MSDQDINIINSDNKLSDDRSISDMYKDWFLDYASYVILERAVPKINDGLKPVQRRILHSMKEMHDSRYHKVANIIGHTMQYHPHGDKAIEDALVSLAQKDLLVDMQGNWGDPRTGDKAAAARYIEARLTQFSLDVIFNKNITIFQSSYDGRKKEPVTLPVKFPLILSQGAEGIAVGLSTKILPHNFVELIKSSIKILKNKQFTIYPDFYTKGMIDIQNYNMGKKGGRVRVRCNIDILNKETLIINDLPYSVTTESLIDSVVKANNAGKIKIKNIEDNTAEKIEIIIHLIKGVSPNVTVDALYAFTNCEISLSPNCCIIVDNKPHFISVNELLKISTNNTVHLLKKELEYKLLLLENKWHIASLERIFIEQKIYRFIEDCTTWELILSTIHDKLKPYLEKLKKEVTDNDIAHLTEIKIKRISKYDINKQLSMIKQHEVDIKEIKININDIINFSIDYFQKLLEKYGFNRNRNTLIQEFDSISMRRVAVANHKLFINRKDGFIGFGIKKDEYICKCSNIDNIIVFLDDGTYLVTQVEEKKYIGKNIIYAAIWKKNDNHMVYNVAYEDGATNFTYIKRFAVTSLIKDKIYNLTRGSENSKVLYFTANPNSESETINIFLHSKSKAKNKSLEYDFDSLSIKNKNSKGNILTKHTVRKINQKSSGSSTLGGRDIWLDENIGRLNAEQRGLYLGSFNSDDKIIIFYMDGSYEMTSFDFSNRYKMSDISLIERFDPQLIYTLLHKDGKTKTYYIKRFRIETNSIGKRFNLIFEARGSKSLLISNFSKLSIDYNYRILNGEKKNKSIYINDFIDIKGWKANGKKLDNKRRMSGFKFKEIVDKEKNENNDDIKLDPDNELTLFK